MAREGKVLKQSCRSHCGTAYLIGCLLVALLGRAAASASNTSVSDMEKGRAGSCDDEQCMALLDLAASVTNDPHQAVAQWTRDNHACGNPSNNYKTWPGVMCDTVYGNVISLDLHGMSLKGTLPESLGMLTFLHQLDLSGNSFSGPLPASLGKLGDYLEHVDLSSNTFNGSLPTSWSGMAAMQNMSLANNSLEGPLPPSWSALSLLEELELSYNRLSGTLPPSWGRLGFLAHLNLRSNRLVGSLPSAWSKQTALLQLDVADNNIEGVLPSEWAEGMDSLRIANISNNSLAGTLPGNWVNMSNLQLLSVSSNQLTGKIPETWNNLQSLYTLSISENSEVCGGIPTSFNVSLTAEEQEKLNKQCLWDTEAQVLIRAKAKLEDTWGALNSWQDSTNPCGAVQWPGVVCSGDGFVQKVVLPNQGLSGGFPTELLGLEKLTEVDLSENNITGTLPSEWPAAPGGDQDPSHLRVLLLASNAMTGTLPDTWITTFAELEVLDLSNNQLTGTLPLSWDTMTNLTVLMLAGNQLNGTLPSTWASPGSWLAVLHLEGNKNLEGTLPAKWGSNNNLKELRLGDNNLEGTIPQDYLGMPALRYLDVNANPQMCGSVPAAVGTPLVIDLQGTRVGKPCPPNTVTSAQLSRSVLGTVIGVTVAACCCIGLAAWGIIHHIQQQRSCIPATKSSGELQTDAAATAASPCSMPLTQARSQRYARPVSMLSSAPISEELVLPNNLAAHITAAAAVPTAHPMTSSPLPSPLPLSAENADVPLGPASEPSGRSSPSGGKCSLATPPKILISISPRHMFSGPGPNKEDYVSALCRSGVGAAEEDVPGAGIAASAGGAGVLQDLGVKARVALLRAGERQLSPLGSPKAGPVGSPRSMPNLGAVTVGGVAMALPEGVAQ